MRFRSGSRTRNRIGENAFSLVEVMVALIILSLIIYFIGKHRESSVGSLDALSFRSAKEDISHIIVDNLDCSATLDISKISMASLTPRDCPSHSDKIGPPYIRLMRQGTNGPVDLLTRMPNSDQDGIYAYGSYLVRSSCSYDEQSLVIQIIPRGVSLNKVTWDSSQAVIFGGGKTNRALCFSNPFYAETLPVTFSIRSGVVGQPSYAGKNRLKNNVVAKLEKQGGYYEGYCLEDEGWRLAGCFPNNADKKNYLMLVGNRSGNPTCQFVDKTNSSALNAEVVVNCIKGR
ncbi:MAG: prepilin-type N-terminal cleavage/methylation domain-containing protein [Proteobacteria bacterium]|nr:MAG: prepilin-type N-terminal cleavage/methylation domain-containing protein [Pseudomonadota bacterium]